MSFLLLLRGECASFCFEGERCHDSIVIHILLAHGFGQTNKEIAVGTVGQLGFNVCLLPTEHYRCHLGPELTQVLVPLRTPPVVQMVILPIEPEEGAEESGVEEIDNGPDLVYPVFQGGTGEDEGESALQSLDCLSRFARPVFYALSFIQDDDVGPQIRIDVEAVAKDLFVIADGKKGWMRVLVVGRSLRGASIDQPLWERGEPPYLLFPFRLERCRGNDQNALGFTEVVKQGAGGDGLNGFAQAHFVGEKGPLLECKVEHAFALIRIQGAEGYVFGVVSCDNPGFIIAATGFPLPIDFLMAEPGFYSL